MPKKDQRIKISCYLVLVLGATVSKDPDNKVAAEKIFNFKDLGFPMSVKAASINKKMPILL